MKKERIRYEDDFESSNESTRKEATTSGEFTPYVQRTYRPRRRRTIRRMKKPFNVEVVVFSSLVVVLIEPLIRFPLAFRKLNAVLEDSFASRSLPMPVLSNFPFPGSIWLSRRKTPIMPDFP